MSIRTGIIILSFQTLEFLPCFYKHWNSVLILPNFEVLLLFLYTLQFWPYLQWGLEFWSYPSHWNCGPVFITLVFWYYAYKQWDIGPISISIGIIILSSQKVEFWSCFYTHWNSNLILPNTAILILSLQTLEYLYRHWNSDLILQNIYTGFILSNIIILALFYKHCNSDHILLTTEIPVLLLHWNSGPFFIKIGVLILSFLRLWFGITFIKIGILILSFQLLQFWPCGPIVIDIGTVILFFQSSEFWSYRTKNCNSCFVFPNIGILTLSLSYPILWYCDLMFAYIGILAVFL